MKPVDHEAWLKQKLQEPEFAAEFLKAASEDKDPRVYSSALRQVVAARIAANEAGNRTRF